jgi:hypothetical protein
MRWTTAIVWAQVASILVIGCSGGDGPAIVSGRVTFDGRTVDDGAIYFVDAGTEVVGGFSRIQAGNYRAVVKRGRWAVRITGNRRVPETLDETGIPLVEQYIPSRFNDATELKATIERSQRHDWTLPGISSS